LFIFYIIEVYYIMKKIIQRHQIPCRRAGVVRINVSSMYEREEVLPECYRGVC